MQIVLTDDDLASFSQPTRNEILRRFGDVMGSLPVPPPVPAPEWRERFDDVHLDKREDITYKLIQRWMDGVSDHVRQGVRLLAEHGPVIEASLLRDAGINLKQFQSATTRRTRKVTGDANAYFLAWNHWTGLDDPQGKFAVSPITHQSLRRYFGLPV